LILKKAIYYAVAVAALAAAAIVCVVFLALALNAALVPVVGPAWGAAAVAAVALAFVAIFASILLAKLHSPHTAKHEDPDLTTRVFELAREKPLVALGAVGTLGVAAAVAMRNPKITAALLSALMAGRATKK
jgi:hypothetical protein